MKKILSIFITAIILTFGVSIVYTPAATTLKLNCKKATIGIREAYTLKSNTSSTKKVKWKSSDNKVAKVNKNGKVTGIKTGKTTITATVGKATATCVVTVKKAPAKVSAKAVTVEVGDTAQIKVKFPKNTASKTLTYKSSDTKIAKVDRNGKVSSLKVGKCNVTVTTYNRKSVIVPVTVKEKEILDKVLIVYFSMPETTNPNNMTTEEANSTVVIDGEVLGNTQYLAYLIQENTDADIFRIEPEKPYPTNHATLVAKAQEEQNQNFRPVMKTKIKNIDEYDAIFLGYPNWWGDMPMILYSFLEEYDLSGKTIIPFNSHGGSGFSDTINTIIKLQPNATVEKNGFTVSRNTVHDAESDVIAWLKRVFA